MSNSGTQTTSVTAPLPMQGRIAVDYYDDLLSTRVDSTLDKVKAGETVAATATITSIKPFAGGLRILLTDADQNTAIAWMSTSDFAKANRDQGAVLHPGAPGNGAVVRPGVPARPGAARHDRRDVSPGGDRVMAAIGRSQADEALARVVADEIGPRRPGVVYDNTDGIFQVLEVVTDRSEARRILRRRAAQFAVIIRDVIREGAEPFAVGTVWTPSDRVLKAVA
jgi:hypothetical protein